MAKSFFRRFTKKFFIISNIILALFFLAGCYGYLFNPQYFWLVGFLTISAFYLLLVLLVFLIFWLFIKPRWALISFASLVLAYKPLTQLIPFRFTSSFNKVKQKPSTLRVMSWNVAQFDALNNKKHPEVKQQMISLINEYQPDIACFQEMVCEDSTVRQHGHIDDYLKQLEFPDYFYSYNRKEDFWDYAHFGIIIFSKYPIINKQSLMWYPNDYNSIFQYVDIVKNADTFRVFNIHLQSLRFSRANLKYLDDPSVENKEVLKQSKSIIGKFKTGFLKRKIQADRVREEIDKSPYPVIVCGDFNDVPNSYAYHTIGSGLKNAFAEKGIWLGRTFSGLAPTLRIDNIFVDKRFDVEQYIRINKKLSDHFPIVSDISKKQE